MLSERRAKTRERLIMTEETKNEMIVFTAPRYHAVVLEAAAILRDF